MLRNKLLSINYHYKSDNKEDIIMNQDVFWQCSPAAPKLPLFFNYAQFNPAVYGHVSAPCQPDQSSQVTCSELICYCFLK